MTAVHSKTPALSIPLCFVFHQAEHAICEGAATALRTYLRELSPLLSEIIQPRPISLGNAQALMEREVSAEHRVEKWEQLQRAGFTPFVPGDSQGKAAPQCILLLSADCLVNKSSRELLVQDLHASADHFSQFLILFFAPPEQVPFGIDDSEIREWLMDWTKIEHKRLSMHLVSPSFEGGEPISDGDLAESTAIALAADLLLENSRSERILSDIQNENLLELSVFGVKMLRFDPLQTADQLTSHVAAKLLLHANSKEDESAQCEPIQITSPIDMLNDCSATNCAASAHSVCDSASGRQSLAFGRDGTVKLPCSWIPNEEQLNAMPETEWVTVLHDSAAALARKLKVTIETETDREIERHLDTELGYLRERVAQAFCGAIGGRSETKFWDDLYRQVRDMYPNSDLPADEEFAATPLERALNELREVVGKIPSAEQLVGKGLIYCLPWPLLGLLAWYLDVPFAGGGLLLGTFLAILGAMRIWTGWRYAKARARIVRHKVLTQMREAAGNALNGSIHNSLRRYGEQFTDKIKEFREAIAAVHARLSPLAECPDRFTAPIGSTSIQRLPTDDQQVEQLFASWWSSDSSVSGVAHKFRGVLRDQLLNILEGNATAEELVAAVNRFALEFCVERLSTLRLWNFFRRDFLNLSPMDGKKIEMTLERLQRRPWIFLQSLLARDMSLQSDRTRHFLVGPRILQPTKSNRGQVTSLVFENTLASIVRVRLAHLSLFYEATNSSKSEAEAIIEHAA